MYYVCMYVRTYVCIMYVYIMYYVFCTYVPTYICMYSPDGFSVLNYKFIAVV